MTKFSEIYKRQRNKKLLFVYAMAKRDIQISLNFLNRIQQRTIDINEREANLLTLFIIYGRIFRKNFDLQKLNINDLQCDLTDDEKSFHEALLKLRDKIFAHSDASMNNIQIFLNDKNELETVSTHNTTLIEYPDIAESLFNKILKSIDLKLNSLLKELYAQEDNYKITDKKLVLMGYSNNFWENYLDK